MCFKKKLLIYILLILLNIISGETSLNIIWGYTPTEVLSSLKEVGNEIKEVKQIFSALIFKNGISGITIKISEIKKEPRITISLSVDDEIIKSLDFSPDSSGEFSFEMEEKIIPKTKIEVAIRIDEGVIFLPISTIGTGMGYHKINDDFVPTNHLPLGLIVP